MDKRTEAQNRALWLYFGLVAAALNDAGLDLRKVLKPDIEVPWNKTLVHDYLWQPVQKLITNKSSTTELDKSKEIELIWEVLNRHLAKHGIYVAFPSTEK